MAYSDLQDHLHCVNDRLQAECASGSELQALLRDKDRVIEALMVEVDGLREEAAASAAQMEKGRAVVQQCEAVKVQHETECAKVRERLQGVEEKLQARDGQIAALENALHGKRTALRREKGQVL
jgi:chromosome segregation ATPase